LKLFVHADEYIYRWGGRERLEMPRKAKWMGGDVEAGEAEVEFPEFTNSF
jgi:hypothetical protein